MSYTKLVQPYKDKQAACPKCGDAEYEADIKTANNGMIVRTCMFGHEYLDSLTLQEQKFLRQMEGKQRTGNHNQYLNRKGWRKHLTT